MLNQYLLAGGLLGGLLLAVFFLMRVSKSKGRTEGKLEATQQIIEIENKRNEIISEANAEVIKQVEQTNETHDKLKSDPAFAERVRSRFSRD